VAFQRGRIRQHCNRHHRGRGRVSMMAQPAVAYPGAPPARLA
jgi:hypothetical protein